MGLLSWLTPISWKQAAAEQVVWQKGWPQSSPRRTLREFWINDPLPIKPTKLPLGTLAKRVEACVDVVFHFDKGNIIIDSAHMSMSRSPNCCSIQGEAFNATRNFFAWGVLEKVLQKQADTEKSDLRSCIYRTMIEERDAAGLPKPSRRGRRGPEAG
jgi:hypothetical protein